MIEVVEVRPQPQETEEGKSRVVFISDDRKSYDATFSNEARRHLLTIFQIEEARHREAKRLALTVRDHTVGLSRQGNALVLVTKEVGPIAFRIPPEMIPDVQRTLGQLARMPQRS